ncbi:MAG TPA: aminopeptidase N [Jatrophihabitans sp.]|nr:aminopeptidase N [Jatrophihabitans sp.]
MASGATEPVLDANTLPTPNITKEEAVLRAGLLSVQSYDVALDLTDERGRPSERTFRSRTTITFDARQPGAATFVDVIADRLHEVSLNGTPVPVEDYRPEHGIALPELAAHNVLVVDADLLYTTIGQGLHRFVDPLDDEVYLYSQFETTDAKRMFACFDQPDLKARFTLQVTAPAHWKVVSNGAVTKVQEGSGHPATKTVHFATTEPISTYLTALVAGNYFEARDEYDDGAGAPIPLGLFCRTSLAEHFDTDELFEVTKQGFRWYHENFGVRYAFGKYDQLFVPEYNAGAMENVGCVTFLEDYVFRSRVTDSRYERRAATVLHEMAHMWFGDLVTMKWFDDLWLNESFAEWAAAICQSEATRWPDAWTTFANIEKTWAYRQDQLPSTHPIACDIPDAEAVEVNFDGITYAKGAAVLKQLVAYVGRDEFLAGVRQYFADHAYGNTTLGDLLSSLKAASGRELSDWAKLWLETSGLNTISPDFEVGADGKYTRFEVVQTAPTVTAKDNVLRPHRLAVGLYNFDGNSTPEFPRGRLVRVHQVQLDLDGERTSVPALIGQAKPDLVLVNDDDLTYCKLRLDPESLVTMRTGGLAAISDTLARTLCWSAAWDMVRDGELAARDYLELATASGPSETEIGVVQSVNAQALRALKVFADPEWAESGRRQFADAVISAARAAEAGSDHQLAWVHAAAGAACTDEHADFLAGLLDGSQVLPGLALDTDLRWLLLQSLVARGRAGAAEIDAFAAEDRAAAGVRAAAVARAMLPTPEGKQAAWDAATRDVSLSNTLMRAAIAGFVQAMDGALLAPFAAKYFEQAGEIWQQRTPETASDLIVGLFPVWSSTISEQTLELADAFLADQAQPPALRRLVGEGRAEVARALHARSVDIARGRHTA